MSVYFAKVGRYIKIGYSENPERRVANLFASTTRYGRPHDCPLDADQRELIRHVSGTKTTERRIHAALADFCVGLEWFIDEPPVREFIASVEGGRRVYKTVPREGGPHGAVRQWAPEHYRSSSTDEVAAWDRFNARFTAMLSGRSA